MKIRIPVEGKCFDKIIQSCVESTSTTLDIWDFIENQTGARRKWSWWHQQNYLVFTSEKDYVMFLLRWS